MVKDRLENSCLPFCLPRISNDFFWMQRKKALVTLYNIKTPIPQKPPRNAGWEIIVGMDYDNNNNNLILEIVSHISNYYPDVF